MDGEVKRRMTWVNMFLETGNAGLTCRRCGISRPTLRKWVRAYENRVEDGLKSKSSRPLRSPSQKINDETRTTILRCVVRKISVRVALKFSSPLERRKSSTLLGSSVGFAPNCNPMPDDRIRCRPTVPLCAAPICSGSTAMAKNCSS